MFDKLRRCGNEIMNCLNENLKNANIGHRIVGDPTLFDVLFLDQDVKNYRDTKKADIKLNALFNKGLRMRGIFKSSAKIYPSLAISDEDLFNTKKAIHDTINQNDNFSIVEYIGEPKGSDCRPGLILTDYEGVVCKFLKTETEPQWWEEK